MVFPFRWNVKKYLDTSRKTCYFSCTETKRTPTMKYIVTHTHRFGTSVYFVICNHYPSRKEVIDYCGIDYEDEGECLEIGRIDDEEFTIIPD
jgi:hypothetical protein